MAAVKRKSRRLRRTSRAGAQEGETLTERAYTALEELIVRLELRPGSAVLEAKLSARLGIGRTPVREALQRLAREHLVVIRPRRSIVISEIDVKSQLRLIEVRREVERLIARSAARRATQNERDRFIELARTFESSARKNDDITFMRVDREFNELCVAAARNEFAAGAMKLMHARSRRFWFLHYKQAADMPRTATLHADMARAIAAGDQEAAARALDRLLDVIETFIHATVTTDF
jgi:DNA-binding GntR family transcriptional regulator